MWELIGLLVATASAYLIGYHMGRIRGALEEQKTILVELEKLMHGTECTEDPFAAVGGKK